MQGRAEDVDEKWAARRARRDAFEDKTEATALVLAVLMIPLLLVPVFVELNDTADTVVIVLDGLIWLAFAVHLVYRVVLTRPREWGKFLRRNWADVVIVVVPFLRPLRIARSVRVFRLLGLVRFAGFLSVIGVETRRLLTRHGLHYVLMVTVGLVFGTAAIVSLLEEDSGGSINSFGTGLWWSLSTITTVGSDVSPVTVYGRAAAVVLMFAGIGLVAALAAQFATFLRERPVAFENEMLARQLAEFLEGDSRTAGGTGLTDEVVGYVLSRSGGSHSPMTQLTARMTAFVVTRPAQSNRPPALLDHRLAKSVAEFIVGESDAVDGRLSTGLAAVILKDRVGDEDAELAVWLAAFVMGQPIGPAESAQAKELADALGALADGGAAPDPRVLELADFIHEERGSGGVGNEGAPSSGDAARPLRSTREIFVALTRFVIGQPSIEVANSELAESLATFVETRDIGSHELRRVKSSADAIRKASDEIALRTALSKYIAERPLSESLTAQFSAFLARQPAQDPAVDRGSAVDNYDHRLGHDDNGPDAAVSSADNYDGRPDHRGGDPAANGRADDHPGLQPGGA